MDLRYVYACPWERVQFGSLTQDRRDGRIQLSRPEIHYRRILRSADNACFLPLVKSSASREKVDPLPGGFHGVHAFGFFQLETNEELSPPLDPIVGQCESNNVS